MRYDETGSLFEEPLPHHLSLQKRRRQSPLQVTLAGVDWALYEWNVYTLLTEAISSAFQAHGDEELCQLSVLTRPQNSQSIVSFEAVEHAAACIERYPMPPFPYNENPRDFVYWEWASFQHAELQPLCPFTRHGRILAIERRLFLSLKAVIKRLLRENALPDYPLSRPFFIGAGSAKDYFEVVAVLR